MALRLASTKNLASVGSCTDTFGYKTLSSPVFEHSPFNPRDLPTSNSVEIVWGAIALHALPGIPEHKNPKSEKCRG
jgi:hypothetical protein